MSSFALKIREIRQFYETSAIKTTSFSLKKQQLDYNKEIAMYGHLQIEMQSATQDKHSYKVITESSGPYKGIIRKGCTLIVLEQFAVAIKNIKNSLNSLEASVNDGLLQKKLINVAKGDFKGALVEISMGGIFLEDSANVGSIIPAGDKYISLRESYKTESAIFYSDFIKLLGLIEKLTNESDAPEPIVEETNKKNKILEFFKTKVFTKEFLLIIFLMIFVSIFVCTMLLLFL